MSILFYRLVEVQHLPWSTDDLLRVIKNGTLKESANSISMEVLPRLSYYMQRVLVRIAREAQRLSQKVFKCSKHEVICALRLILSPQIASNSVKASVTTNTIQKYTYLIEGFYVNHVRKYQILLSLLLDIFNTKERQSYAFNFPSLCKS